MERISSVSAVVTHSRVGVTQSPVSSKVIEEVGTSETISQTAGDEVSSGGRDDSHEEFSVPHVGSGLDGNADTGSRSTTGVGSGSDSDIDSELFSDEGSAITTGTASCSTPSDS